MKKSSDRDNVVLFPGETAADVELAAAEWLTRMNSGSCSASDLIELALWRTASPDHDRVYREMQRLWNSIRPQPSRLAQLWSGLREIEARNLGLALRAAAMALAVIGVGLTSRYLSVWRYGYHTGPGEIRSVVLADGSTVSLNGDTALNVKFTEKGARVVELGRGEAYFEVGHNAARPFVVEAGAGVVRDLGTGFTVSRHGQSGEVSVDHGSVDVIAGGRSQTLVKQQSVRFGLYDLSAPVPVNTDLTTAWRRGLYFAQDARLGDVLHDLTPYYRRPIVVLNQDLSARRINAVVQLNHLDAWLDALSKTKGIAVRKVGPLVVISKDSA